MEVEVLGNKQYSGNNYGVDDYKICREGYLLFMAPEILQNENVWLGVAHYPLEALYWMLYYTGKVFRTESLITPGAQSCTC